MTTQTDAARSTELAAARGYAAALSPKRQKKLNRIIRSLGQDVALGCIGEDMARRLIGQEKHKLLEQEKAEQHIDKLRGGDQR